MKTAVIFSGLVRGDYETAIKNFKRCFDPDTTDFFFVTWDFPKKSKKWQKESTREYYPFINRYYKQPKISYFPNKAVWTKYARVWRILKENDFDVKGTLPPGVIRNRPDDVVIEEMRGGLNNRVVQKNQTKQHLIHAYAVRDLIDKSKYDVIVRVRYDIVVNRNLKYMMPFYLKTCFDTKTPIGFHTYNNDSVYGFLSGTPDLKFRLSSDMHDFVIIHRADMFDPEHVIYRNENHNLEIAEGGWWQIICDPYGVQPYIVNNMIRLTAQGLDEKIYLEKERAKPSWTYESIHGCKENMRMMYGSIADKVGEGENNKPTAHGKIVRS